MIALTKLSEITDGIVRAFAACIPEAEHQKGRLAEDYSAPAFLYIPVFSAAQRSTAFVSEVTVELQVIYFGKSDGKGMPEAEELEVAVERLRPFLDGYQLSVGERVFKFAYEIKDVDGRLAIYLKFRFYETVACREETRQLVEDVYFEGRMTD